MAQLATHGELARERVLCCDSTDSVCTLHANTTCPTLPMTRMHAGTSAVSEERRVMAAALRALPTTGRTRRAGASVAVPTTAAAAASALCASMPPQRVPPLGLPPAQAQSRLPPFLHGHVRLKSRHAGSLAFCSRCARARHAACACAHFRACEQQQHAHQPAASSRRCGASTRLHMCC